MCSPHGGSRILNERPELKKNMFCVHHEDGDPTAVNHTIRDHRDRAVAYHAIKVMKFLCSQ